jgi:hypothetical protein
MRPDVHNCSANDIIKPNTIMAVHSLSHSTISIFVVNNNNENQVVNSSMPNTSNVKIGLISDVKYKNNKENNLISLLLRK